MTCVTLAANITSALVSVTSSNQRFFLKFAKHAQSGTLDAYSAIIVQIFYAFVFYVVSSCCDDALFGPVAFKNA
jgi:hypothetical protein